jgi:hypothetical protein
LFCRLIVHVHTEIKGPTCKCTYTPACRHDHKRKQTPGWTLTTPTPGTLIWTTPGNRTHTTTPAHYPD